MFDHCRLSNGDMIEAKGHYASVLKFSPGRESVVKEFIDQAVRQIAAADANEGRRIEWHFYETETMEFARKLFDQDPRISGRIKLVYDDYPGTLEWPYPKDAQRTWAKGRQKQ